MTQTEAIARHLTRGQTLTALSALHLFGCLRLAARIGELKERGFRMQREMVTRGKRRYARYSWAGAMKKPPVV